MRGAGKAGTFDVLDASRNGKICCPIPESCKRKPMSAPEAVFKIIENNSCPLYELGDEFALSGQALLLKSEKDKTFITTSVIRIPIDKAACRILVEDITAVLIKYESMASVHRCVINCSGCSGIIRLEYKKHKKLPAPPAVRKSDEDISTLVSLLYIFPIFQTLDEEDIRKIVPMLKLKKFAKGTNIIEKGEPGSNLYIIISGKVEVLADKNISIDYLERGDVFGEISLLIGTSVRATIHTVLPTRVLFITGKDFKTVLDMFPSMQYYFARLLAERLAKTNDERFEEISSGMIGNLNDMPSTELFQTLNLNHKTGVLQLALPKGSAKTVFRDGSLVGAYYNGLEGKEAFFEILKEKKGRFKFIQGLSAEQMEAPEVGDFMWLLMEGSRKIDEARSA